MKAIKNAKIIAIVGMTGSGKSTVVDYLTTKNYPKVYFGGMVYNEMNRRGIEITPESQQKFREQIREEEGKDWVINQVISEVHKLVESGQRHIILDGLYTWSEYKILKHEFPGETTVLAIISPKALRHKRLGARPERPFTEQEANERDYSEIENLEKGGPIAAADYYIANAGSLEQLEKDVDKFLADIGFAS
ncbi:MAG: AAA family ATPase [Candidatus Nomurabacteria bacterium]|jgi:dephospho-CoA kinase|nr:AAA family ATPase [Candidatus Nomurabacteria bacterium]